MFLPFCECRSECNGVSLRSDFYPDVTMAQKGPSRVTVPVLPEELKLPQVSFP